jgi:putative membrane protein
MQLLLRWLITAGALYATVWVLKLIDQASIKEGPWYGWFFAVIIMALVNALIRPVARLLTAPLNCLTFGLMGVVVNAVMFWLVPVLADAAGMPVFSVTVLGALLGSLLVGAIGGLLNQILIRDDEKE